MTRIIKITSVILIIALCISLTACYEQPVMNQQDSLQTGLPKDADSDEILDKGPVAGGVVRLFSTQPDTLNPLLTKNMFVQDFTGMIFEGLFKLAKDQSVVPVLCDRYDVSTDGLIWTFHIRDGVMWQDNTPLTAEDVKYSFDVILDKKNKSIYKSNLENVAIYSAVDKSNFRIFLKRPDSFSRERLTFPIVSRHHFAGDDLDKLNSPANMEPVGTGPFKMGHSEDPNTISLLANRAWWNGEGKDEKGLKVPYLDGIDIKIYPEASDAVNAFQTRDIDVAALQSSDFSKYNGRSDLVVRKYISKNFEFISFNLSNPILGDKAVRQAISYALDKVGIFSDIIPGEAAATDLPILPNTWLNSTSILSKDLDITKAKEILTADGWKEEESGLMSKIAGGKKIPLKFEILVNDFNDIRYKLTKRISEQLRLAGMEVTIKKLSWDELNLSVQTRKFDAVFMGCKVTSVPDISFAYASTEIAAGTNISGYNNPQVDNFLSAIKSENDTARKSVLLSNLKTVINDDVPSVGLFFYNNAMLYSNRIRGAQTPMAWDKYNDITLWYIPVKK